MLEGLQANSNQGKEDVSYPEIKKRKKKAIQKWHFEYSYRTYWKIYSSSIWVKFKM